MKGFIDEFNERTDSMTTLITELESKLKEKDKTIEKLKEGLSLKDKALTELKDMLATLGKQLVKEKIEGVKKDKTISELGKHETKLSMDLIRMKNEVNALKQSFEKDKKGGE